MTELERVKELTPKFQLTVLNNINIIDSTLLEIICVDVTKNAEDIRKRIGFGNYFEKLGLQSKIDLVKIILESNNPDIFKQFPNYFDELNNLKVYRNSIAHSSIAFERDSNEENAKLILQQRKIIKTKKLSEKDMLDIMNRVTKCTEDTRKIFTLIGKTKGLRF